MYRNVNWLLNYSCNNLRRKKRRAYSVTFREPISWWFLCLFFPFFWFFRFSYFPSFSRFCMQNNSKISNDVYVSHKIRGNEVHCFHDLWGCVCSEPNAQTVYIASLCAPRVSACFDVGEQITRLISADLDWSVYANHCLNTCDWNMIKFVTCGEIQQIAMTKINKMWPHGEIRTAIPKIKLVNVFVVLWDIY